MNNERTSSLVVFLLAFGVRLMGIGSRPIWEDEAFAELVSKKGLKAVPAGTLKVDASWLPKLPG